MMQPPPGSRTQSPALFACIVQNIDRNNRSASVDCRIEGGVILQAKVLPKPKKRGRTGHLLSEIRLACFHKQPRSTSRTPAQGHLPFARRNSEDGYHPRFRSTEALKRFPNKKS